MHDIVVGGSGVLGLFCGLCFGALGYKTSIVGPKLASSRHGDDSSPFDGRAFAISASTVRLLETLQLKEVVLAHAQPIAKIAVCGDAGSHLSFLQDTNDPLGFIIPHEDLYRLLEQMVLTAQNVTYIEGQVLETRETNPYVREVEIARRDGRSLTLETALLVCAFGAQGRSIPGVSFSFFTHAYAQTALVGAIAHSKNHEGVAYEYFRDTGPFAILPLPGGFSSSLVWVEPENNADALWRCSKIDSEAFQKEFHLRLGDCLGEAVLQAPLFRYPLQLSVAHEMVKSRMCLVGDMAHTIHPLAGQGLNLGVRDLVALRDVLYDSKKLGLDMGHLVHLGNYERARYVDMAGMLVATHALNALFSNKNPVLRALRNAGLSLFDQSKIGKRFAKRYAAGEMHSMTGRFL